MRLAPSLLVSALCWTARWAEAVQVYSYDFWSPPGGNAERWQRLSPTHARLVLAQRTGVEDYHLDDLLQGGGIDAINEFASRQVLLQEAELRRRRVVMLVEVDGDVDATIEAQDTGHFTVAPAPSADSTRALFLDLARQRWPGSYAPLSDARLVETLETATVSHDAFGDEAHDVFHILTKPSMQEFARFWQDVITLAHARGSRIADPRLSYSVTAIVIPAAKSSNADADQASWGHYTMPADRSASLTAQPLHKRQQEEPLDDDTTTTSSSNNPFAIQQNPNATSPLPGILPACFSTREACIQTTRNCTGHGTCQLAFTDPSHEEADSEQCYSCQCVSTLVETTDDDGNPMRRTIVWAGPACQKRDVSTSFWLLAGLTVAMVFLISFAVGSLMSCGDETLPSVIGAGVSGAGVRGRQ